ncbi:hypothetical protein [Natrinema sp. SYSU A 869]|uniref:hypothetical protein n=1 Tax=Natrinema sp. SYSU A 869 TaxID=2871694 RepID=UPI001CA40ADB|nr:hypothetical protein [Natrinema sp. SYSU A 869]
MSEFEYKDDRLIAVALTEFSVQYEQADPELAEHAWQLAATRLVDHDRRPARAVDELEIGAPSRE